tara:strand:+ start:167 stop:1258 length:1092 start_codon:yes stop_codon:yes gene_type:complete
MGLLDNIKGGPSPSMSNNDRSALALGLASGFAGMSGNPNTASIMAGIEGQQASLAARREKEEATKLLSSQSNATLMQLKAGGVPDEVLAVARTNPELLKTITGEFVKSKYGKSDMLKFTGVQTDPKTGQQYTIMSNPNDGTSTRIDVAGAIGQTPTQKLEIENAATTRLADIAMAQKKGFAAFDRASAMDESLVKLESAREAVKNGASSGFLARFVPSFSAATTSLRNTANSLGIDIINSATFGALSEKELQLALSTGLDLSLQGEELNKHILEKIAAQTKMRDWLISQSKILTKGDVTYSSYIQKYNAEKPRANPIVNYASPQNAGSGATGTGGLVLSKKQIDIMTPKQKAAFEQLTGVKLP